MKTVRSLDDIRLAYPKIGFAVYAYEAGGPVTLEIHGLDGQVFTFAGPTEAAAIERAFPPVEPPPLAPPINVFD